MKKFLDAVEGVGLVLWTALFSVLTWNYYQANPQMFAKDNWLTLGLLVAGCVLIGLGFWAVSNDHNAGGIILAVIGAVLIVLALVYRMQMVTFWLAIILILAMLTICAAATLAIGGLHDGGSSEQHNNSDQLKDVLR